LSGAGAAEAFMAASAGPRLSLIAESFARLTGRPLLEAPAVSPQALWRAPFALLAHGTQADPLFFYGNRLALELFEVEAEALVRMPSRRSAESPEQAERARLLATVARDGFIDVYAGVRVSARGRRFRIEHATVWNLIDAAGVAHGQAAAFARWTPIE
jgi:hypothetical protein